MRAIRTLTWTWTVLTLMTISLATVDASILTTTTNTTQSNNENDGIDISISNETLHVDTPLNPSIAPITIKVFDSNGNELYSRIVADGIDHLIIGGFDRETETINDEPDHRIVGDGIDHLVQVSQGGMVIYNRTL